MKIISRQLMTSLITGSAGAVLAVALVLGPELAIARTACESLASLSLPGAVITSALDVPAGSLPSPGACETEEFSPFADSADGRPFAGLCASGDLPAFCRVTILVKPQINIEVWLPKDKWNRRFRGEGAAGFAGFLNYAGMAHALRAGYATASTDTGHRMDVGAAFAVAADGSLNQQLIDDFAFRSLHELVLKAKSVIKSYYGAPPRYSYWRGCSHGGREGLVAVQRFPEEYDGVLAGSPSINWDRLLPALLWPQITILREVGHPISADKLDLATNAAVAECDGYDGVVDGIISNPRNCRYDPSALVCNEEKDQACLTNDEARAIRKIWEGPRSAKNGEQLWFGVERGARLSSLASSRWDRESPSADYFRYWIRRDPAFDWRTMDLEAFERSIRDSYQRFNGVMGTDEPNLQRWARRGGKLLVWHDESDEVVPPRGTLNYFQRVAALHENADRVSAFARLYMVPGSGHCGLDAGAPFPETMFESLVDWVERGIAPERIIATQRTSGRIRTRLLCPYPKREVWTGRGRSDDADNSSCVKDAVKPDDFGMTVFDTERLDSGLAPSQPRAGHDKR